MHAGLLAPQRLQALQALQQAVRHLSKQQLPGSEQHAQLIYLELECHLALLQQLLPAAALTAAAPATATGAPMPPLLHWLRSFSSFTCRMARDCGGSGASTNAPRMPDLSASCQQHLAAVQQLLLAWLPTLLPAGCGAAGAGAGGGSGSGASTGAASRRLAMRSAWDKRLLLEACLAVAAAHELDAGCRADAEGVMRVQEGLFGLLATRFDQAADVSRFLLPSFDRLLALRRKLQASPADGSSAGADAMEVQGGAATAAGTPGSRARDRGGDGGSSDSELDEAAEAREELAADVDAALAQLLFYLHGIRLAWRNEGLGGQGDDVMAPIDAAAATAAAATAAAAAGTAAAMGASAAASASGAAAGAAVAGADGVQGRGDAAVSPARRMAAGSAGGELPAGVAPLLAAWEYLAPLVEDPDAQPRLVCGGCARCVS